jgi:hypothetical protein
MMSDIVHYENGKWYFWQECWSDKYGPFLTKEETEAALKYYCNTVLSENHET